MAASITAAPGSGAPGSIVSGIIAGATTGHTYYVFLGATQVAALTAPSASFSYSFNVPLIAPATFLSIVAQSPLGTPFATAGSTFDVLPVLPSLELGLALLAVPVLQGDNTNSSLQGRSGTDITFYQQILPAPPVSGNANKPLSFS